MKKSALDAIDIRILCALQKHGPLSKSRLAERVGLSPTPCWTRYARLKSAGLIRGFHADIELTKIVDVSKVIVTVSLQSHRKADFDGFERFVHQRLEVIDCMATGGGMDYVLTVVTTSLPAFQNLMDQMLAAHPGIDRYMTYIATRQVKSARPDLALLVTDSRSSPRPARNPPRWLNVHFTIRESHSLQHECPCPGREVFRHGRSFSCQCPV